MKLADIICWTVCVIIILIALTKCTVVHSEELRTYELTIKNRHWTTVRFAIWNEFTGHKVWGEMPRYRDHTIRLQEGVYWMVWAGAGSSPHKMSVILTSDRSFTVWSKDRMEAAIRVQRYLLPDARTAG